MTLGAVLLPLFLSAAPESGVSAKKIVLPSGEQGYSIRCDNLNMNLCYEKAGETCFRGYDILNETKDQGMESSAGGYAGPGFTPGTSIGFSGSNSRTTTEKGLLIQCKDPIGTEIERKVRDRAAEKSRLERQAREEAERAAGSRVAAAIVGGSVVLILLTAMVAASN